MSLETITDKQTDEENNQTTESKEEVSEELEESHVHVIDEQEKSTGQPSTIITSATPSKERNML